MLILASASPRRRELLSAAGLDYQVRVAAIDETRRPGEPAEALVVRLAREKADAVPCATGEVLLAADTLVAVNNQILGKPVDANDARGMLQLLSGRGHTVFTGICLRSASQIRTDIAATWVRFASLSAEEIDSYIETGEPLDKAGAYAIQGLASKFINSIDGSYSNVVGLPVALVYNHLKGFPEAKLR